MAQPIRIQCRLQYNNGLKTIDSGAFDKFFDQAGGHGGSNIQTIHPSFSTPLDTPIGISTPGYFLAKNCDTANYVLLWFDTDEYGFSEVPPIKIPPGGITLIPLNVRTVWAISNAAPVDLFYVFLEA